MAPMLPGLRVTGAGRATRSGPVQARQRPPRPMETAEPMSARSLFSARSFADRAATRRAAVARAPETEAEGTGDAAAPAPGTVGSGGRLKEPIRAKELPDAQGLADAPAPFVAQAATKKPGPKNAPGQDEGGKDGSDTAAAPSARGTAPAPASVSLLTPQPAEGSLRLVPLQALAKGGRWRTEAMRSHRMPLLLWFTRGQGRITIAGLKRGYGAHNAVFIPPRTMHGFEVTAQVFGTAVFFPEQTDLPLPQRPLHLRVRDGIAQGEVTTILEQLGREIDGDRPARSRAIHHHAGLLSVWLDRQAGLADDTAPDTASLRLVRRFTGMVEAQLYTAQGVSDYAEALGVTPTHLSRVCRETCGRSASDILADRLTFEARRLLAETTLPVKQVARILGYGSAAYFTRAFQNRTGQTPTQFRAAA